MPELPEIDLARVPKFTWGPGDIVIEKPAAPSEPKLPEPSEIPSPRVPPAGL